MEESAINSVHLPQYRFQSDATWILPADGGQVLPVSDTVEGGNVRTPQEQIEESDAMKNELYICPRSPVVGGKVDR